MPAAVHQLPGTATLVVLHYRTFSACASAVQWLPGGDALSPFVRSCGIAERSDERGDLLRLIGEAGASAGVADHCAEDHLGPNFAQVDHGGVEVAVLWYPPDEVAAIFEGASSHDAQENQPRREQRRYANR
jgi:hypothetical protein